MEPAGDVATNEEIVVWGQAAEDAARDALIHRLSALGWSVRDQSATEVRFRSAGWLGEATFHADGTFSFRRSAVGFRSRPETEWTSPPPSGDWVVGVGPTLWIGPSSRKLDQARAQLVDATRPEVEAYLAVLWRTALEERVSALPDALDRLWRAGEPLDPGGAALGDADARRQAVLEFWATRADSAEGERVCSAVEQWLAAVVQASDAPITDAERAEYEARRADGRHLP